MKTREHAEYDAVEEQSHAAGTECEICGRTSTTDVCERCASSRQMTAGAHTQEEDCTVDPSTDCCVVCGVGHSDPCARCGKRGYHADGCAESDATTREQLYKTAVIAVDPHLHTKFSKGDVVAVEHYREFGGKNQYLVAKTREGLAQAREDLRDIP